MTEEEKKRIEELMSEDTDQLMLDVSNTQGTACAGFEKL